MYKICHSEASSQRQRELERGLLEIPRKSFYRYFPTKEDCLLALIDHTLSDCNDIALKNWDGTQEVSQQVQLRFFRYWKDQEPFLDAVRDNGFRYLLLDRTTAIVDRMKENSAADKIKHKTRNDNFFMIDLLVSKKM